jgi:hypothetical protein
MVCFISVVIGRCVIITCHDWVREKWSHRGLLSALGVILLDWLFILDSCGTLRLVPIRCCGLAEGETEHVVGCGSDWSECFVGAVSD